MVRGSKGGLQSSAAARCSSNRVAGGGGTELSPAAGRSCRATPTRRARARACYAELARGTVGATTRAGSAVLARGTEGAITRAGFAVLARGTVRATTRAKYQASIRAVLARETGLARSLGIKSALGRTGGACASQKCNECNWERETGRQVRERRPIRQCDPSQCDLSQHASGRGYCVRASRGVHMTRTSSRSSRGWRVESRLSLKAKASWAPL